MRTLNSAFGGYAYSISRLEIVVRFFVTSCRSHRLIQDSKAVRQTRHLLLAHRYLGRGLLCDPLGVHEVAQSGVCRARGKVQGVVYAQRVRDPRCTPNKVPFDSHRDMLRSNRHQKVLFGKDKRSCWLRVHSVHFCLLRSVMLIIYHTAFVILLP